MQLIYLFFIAFINSIDNVGIGVAYSIAKIKVPFVKNILISFLAFAVSFVASFSGGVIAHFLSGQACSIVSMLLLVFMGGKMVFDSFTKEDAERHGRPKILGYREAITIGTILALDDIGSSVSSGLIGYSPFMISLPYFVISFLIFFLGNYAAQFFSKLNIGRKATITAGVLMILMGLLNFIE